MAPSTDSQVVDFFGRLLGRIFSEPFENVIEQRLKRNAVLRQVEESADAASQPVAPFLLNKKLPPEHVTETLRLLGAPWDSLALGREAGSSYGAGQTREPTGGPETVRWQTTPAQRN